MRLARCTQIGLAAAVAAAAALAAQPAPSFANVSVHVQRPRDVRQSVHVRFRAHALASGGYYYAVIVLARYRGYTRSSPPPCATSSNMQRTDYGHPSSHGEVTLALTPARSSSGHWCRGGAYAGAIYAVPHAPPCEGRYPCRSEPYEPPSPCWSVNGHILCGVVALPQRYAYPGGLPAPLARGTRILARFSVVFPP